MFDPLSTTPLLAIVVTLIMLTAAIHLFPLWRLLDSPRRYGLTRLPLPYPGGLAAVVSFFLLIAFLPLQSLQAWGLCAGVAILAVTCLIDDHRRLHPLIRLTLQTLVALLIFATGSRIYTITNPLPFLSFSPFLKLDTLLVSLPFFGSLPVWSGFFTVVWLLLTINALNWFDGLPGQVSALSSISFLVIGMLSLSDRVGQENLAIIAFSCSAIALVCTAFEFPVQRMVLGDTGAMFFGLLLGTLTIYAGGKVATAFLVLGVPLIDSIFVTLRRISQGRSPLRGSSTGDHLHHRLLAKGWHAREIMLLTTVIGAGFGTLALFLSTQGKLAAGIFLVIIVGLLRYWTRETVDEQKAQSKKQKATKEWLEQ